MKSIQKGCPPWTQSSCSFPSAMRTVINNAYATLSICFPDFINIGGRRRLSIEPSALYPIIPIVSCLATIGRCGYSPKALVLAGHLSAFRVIRCISTILLLAAKYSAKACSATASWKQLGSYSPQRCAFYTLPDRSC